MKLHRNFARLLEVFIPGDPLKFQLFLLLAEGHLNRKISKVGIRRAQRRHVRRDNNYILIFEFSPTNKLRREPTTLLVISLLLPIRLPSIRS